MQKFSAHFGNWYSVMESAANVDLGDSEPGPWPNLRTMFQYKGNTENSVKFSCLFCDTRLGRCSWRSTSLVSPATSQPCLLTHCCASSSSN